MDPHTDQSSVSLLRCERVAVIGIKKKNKKKKKHRYYWEPLFSYTFFRYFDGLTFCCHDNAVIYKMAVSAQLEREDSFLEGHRISLLDVIEDKNRSLNKKNLIHRMVYIGKLKEDIDDRTEVGSYYERLLKNLQNNYVTEPITGLLLVYLKHLVHVIEASTDMFLEVMQDIEKLQKDDDGFLEQAKILVISHDISSRLYQQWNFRTLDIQAARMEAYETSEADKVIIDILSQLLKLGNKLAITPKISLKQTLDSLHDKYPDLLPQQAHLNYLMEENDDCMTLPNEYIDIYKKPFDVKHESELVWPLPTRLFPYS